LVAYQGPGTLYSGATVGPLQNSALSADWTGGGRPDDVFSVFDSLVVSGTGLESKSAVVSRQGIGFGAPATAADSVEGRLSSLPDSASLAIVPLATVRAAGTFTHPASALASAVDQALEVAVDSAPQDVLIGDLAFDQVSSGTLESKVHDEA
jgi:hypothetical protein